MSTTVFESNSAPRLRTPEIPQSGFLTAAAFLFRPQSRNPLKDVSMQRMLGSAVRPMTSFLVALPHLEVTFRERPPQPNSDQSCKSHYHTGGKDVETRICQSSLESRHPAVNFCGHVSPSRSCCVTQRIEKPLNRDYRRGATSCHEDARHVQIDQDLHRLANLAACDG